MFRLFHNVTRHAVDPFTNLPILICPKFKSIRDFLFSEFSEAHQRAKQQNNSITSFLYKIKNSGTSADMVRDLNSANSIQYLKTLKDNGSAVCKELDQKKLMPPAVTYNGLEDVVESLRSPLKVESPSRRSGP